jgi:HSP20 family protein
MTIAIYRIHKQSIGGFMSNAIERWFNKKSLNPFQNQLEIQDSFDRLFNEFMNLKMTNGIKDLPFSPSCELTEQDNNYVLKFDLPGISKENVQVVADNDNLIVRAERKEEKKSETKKKFFSEVYYGSYARSFTMPGPIDDKQIDAKFDNGVLTIKVPKSESSNAKRIAIH